jgi:hydroxypyruvate reductase
MMEALADILDARLTRGIAIPKYASGYARDRVAVIAGNHPVPGAESLAAGRAVLELIGTLTEDDLLICLISGGGSALMTTPIAGISLSDMQHLTEALLANGATIHEINAIRRRLDQLKGGGLAQLAAPATVVSLILSDVVGNPLEAIASGPSVPDPTPRAEVLALLEKYRLAEPDSNLWQLISARSETPKPNDPLFARVHNVIVGSNLLAAQAALKQAAMEGFNPYLMRVDLQGEARTVAPELCWTLRWTYQTGDPVPRPACIVVGGETTVTLTGRGRGGRNTELALAAVTELADFPNVMLVTLATDGEDGPTDAAGAVVSGETLRRAHALELSPAALLRDNDSYHFFEKLDDLIKTGPTGTNVNDLLFMFAF